MPKMDTDTGPTLDELRAMAPHQRRGRPGVLHYPCGCQLYSAASDYPAITAILHICDTPGHRNGILSVPEVAQ